MAVVAESVELVIVNLRDLRTSGVHAARAIRSRFPEAAMIVVSTQLSRSLPGESPLARALGANCLIAKPLNRDELLAAVVSAIGAAG